MAVSESEALMRLEHFLRHKPTNRTVRKQMANDIVLPIVSSRNPRSRSYDILSAFIRDLWELLNDNTRAEFKEFFINRGLFSEEHLMSYKFEPNLLVQPSINEDLFFGVLHIASHLFPSEFYELNGAMFKILTANDSQVGTLTALFLLHHLIPSHTGLYKPYFHVLLQWMDSLSLYASAEYDPHIQIPIDVKIPFWACRVRIGLISLFGKGYGCPTIARRASDVLGRCFRELNSDKLVAFLLWDLTSVARDREKTWAFVSGFGGLMKLLIKSCARYMREDDLLESHHAVVTYNTIVRALFLVATVARTSPQAVTPHVKKLRKYFVKLSQSNQFYVRRITLSILVPLGLAASEEAELRGLHDIVFAGEIPIDAHADDERMIESTYEDIHESLSGE